MRIVVTSVCRAEQEIILGYGGGEFSAAFDKAGRADITVDCFAGSTTPVELKFVDETIASIPVEAQELDKTSKVAILWRAPVNLDLHALEYAALSGSPGHVSPASPRSLAAIREQSDKANRGYGFVSTISSTAGTRDRLEVYTFLHREGQSHGSVAIAVDNETRGPTPFDQHCGEAQLAEIPFRIVIMNRKGTITREAGLIASAPCGIPISDAARIDPSTLPALRAKW